MIKIHLFPRIFLAVVFLAACAPMGRSISSGQTTGTPGSTGLITPGLSTPAALSGTEVAPPSPLPLATSRGSELHATDPTTVDLASGGLQLVEFFRFT